MIHRFRWQIKDKLAGMSRPILNWTTDRDSVDSLKQFGITAIISLTEAPLPEAALAEHGIRCFHFPIPDGARPDLTTIRAAVETIARNIDEGEKVAVHCAAGLGRTGTILACYLVHTGMAADDAIKAVRREEPYAIEGRHQEEAVAEYEGFLKKTGRRG